MTARERAEALFDALEETLDGDGTRRAAIQAAIAAAEADAYEAAARVAESLEVLPGEPAPELLAFTVTKRKVAERIRALKETP